MAGSLRIRVLEGRKLIPMDVGGTSDPFVRLVWNDGASIKQTETRFRTLKPLWEGADDDNQFVFLTDAGTNTLVMEVYDYDTMGGNDFIGRAVLTWGKGSSLAWSDTTWVDLVGRPGDADDAKHMEKYGGLGQIRIRYTYTYFPMSKFFAAEPLLKQLGKPVPSPPAKVQRHASPAALRKDMERLSLHAWRVAQPVMYVRDMVRGYCYTPRTGKVKGADGEYDVQLLDQQWKVRWLLYTFVTCLTLLEYIPLSVTHRASRAVVPLTLLWVLLLGTHGTRSKIESGEACQQSSANPFLYLQSPVVFEAAFGVERGWAGYGVPEAEAPRPQKLNTRRQLSYADAPAGNTSQSSLCRQASAGTNGSTSSIAVPTSLRATDEDIQESIEAAAGRIRTLAVQAESLTEAFSWQRQEQSQNLLTKVVLVLLFVLLVPRPPTGIACWIAFNYLFFVHRLYFTHRSLWEKLALSVWLERLTKRVTKRVDPYTSLKDVPAPPPTVVPPIALKGRGLGAAAPPVRATPRGFKPGDRVDVEYEEEGADGGWVRRVDQGTVHEVDGDTVAIDWGCGGEDDLYRCSQRFVTHTLNATSPPASVPVTPREPAPAPLAVGDTVNVQYEVDMGDGGWKPATGTARVVAVRADEVDVDWGDGDVPYTTQKKFVRKAAVPTGQAQRNGVALPTQKSTAELRPGDRVIVEYEIEDDDGDWRLTTSCAIFAEHLPQDEVRVTWVGTTEDYMCHRKHVRYAEQPPVCFNPGDVVTVDYERENPDNTWTRTRSDAVVKSVTNDNRVEVAWLDTEETYVTSPSYLTFAKGADGDGEAKAPATRGVETAPIAPVADLVPMFESGGNGVANGHAEPRGPDSPTMK
eukprot:TRINITY_DN8399_c0_g1_i8.p1 TRINITY_DN8399_c0_g1~~TRINITY_DN8399_c0_g1_i8.p1  ORF type:complete len:860 (+),score=256.22 TRINITY_DN8399_c0_g1_i8:91-2670(+)